MHYYLYEVRNNLNGKIYVGVHKTKSLDDGYMGSGKVIKRAIEKHGIENFTKTILETFESSEAMYAREKEVVTEEFLARDDVYNLRRGGFGGFEYIARMKLNGFCDRSVASKGRVLADTLLKARHGAGFQSKIGKVGGQSSLILGKGIHSTEVDRVARSKRASIAASKVHMNSMWITNGISSRKIQKTNNIPEGWRQGRHQVWNSIQQ